MRSQDLLRASLRHHARSHAAVVLGVATAVAVLAGALLVGSSVRASLERLALERLGRTHAVISTRSTFRAALGDDLGGAALLALRGSVSRQDGSRRAADVLVYGVDERFFAFHGRPARSLGGRDALLSPDLAAELDAPAGQALVVLVETVSDIPGNLLFGRRDEPGRRLAVTAAGVLPREDLGELALRPTAREVRAVFLPLGALQRALGLPAQVNTVLLPSGHRDPLAALRLEDLGLRLQPAAVGVALTSRRAVLDDATANVAVRVAGELGVTADPYLVYVARAIRRGELSVPYSTVMARGEGATGSATPNGWAAQDLQARAGDVLELEYDVWRSEGHLEPGRASLRVEGVLPTDTPETDPGLVPSYPGITEADDLADWDPPFPVDLGSIRPRDEEYWDTFRARPKLVLPLADGQRLWGHPSGRLTGIWLGTEPWRPAGSPQAFEAAFLRAAAGERAVLTASGIEVTAVREQALAASRGTTDFGEYFVYFSFFLVASALLLAGLFFRLGLEQRVRELGLLRAVGFTRGRLLAVFLAEGALLALLGTLIGTAGAVGYARLILGALGGVWSGAVGTRELELHVSAAPLVVGAGAGLLAAAATIALTVRALVRLAPRELLGGAVSGPTSQLRRPGRWPALVAGALAAAAVVAGFARWLPASAAFFAAGGSLLVCLLLAARRVLRSGPGGVSSLGALGRRAAAFRPGRSLACIGLVAGASFIIVAVGAFRQDGAGDLRVREGESGGYTLLATSAQPIHHDPRTTGGREGLGLGAEPLHLARFRMSAGEDASCLNLYRPTRPTLLGAEPAFLREGRFSFASSLAETDEERANPWLLLERPAADGAVPVVADATTLQYVLHVRLGDVMPLDGGRVRFVAALRPGLLQGSLVTSEAHLATLAPREGGYRFFLIDAPPGREANTAERLEAALGDLGLDVTPAAARLHALHRVENTYIATFQSLGLLGLLLGTAGLAAVLVRNAVERRRELALLQAVGYRGAHLARMAVGENGLLLGAGLLCGLLPALVAILPALRERGAGLPLGTAAAVALLVAVVGAAVTLRAVRVIRRWPLLASLRSE
jgi:putative ABC transport system permease protein